VTTSGSGLLWLLALLALLALIPAKIAANKGRSFWLWYGFGIAFWIVALIAALVAKDARPRCRYCAEPVRAEASVCPHCHREMQPAVAPQRDWNTEYAGILEDRGAEPQPEGVCGSCGAPLDPDDRFCRRCGAPMGLERARHLFEEGYVRESARLLHQLKVEAATRGETTRLDEIDGVISQMRALLNGDELDEFDHLLTVGV
jgi:hypothetical protein